MSLSGLDNKLFINDKQLTDPKFLHSLNNFTHSFPHNSDNPLSEAAKQADTNVIAITDA